MNFRSFSGRCQRQGVAGADKWRTETEGGTACRPGETDQVGRFAARWTANDPDWGLNGTNGREQAKKRRAWSDHDDGKKVSVKKKQREQTGP